MPLYSYQAIDKQGKRLTEHIEAGNESDVKETLRKQNLILLTLTLKRKKLLFSKNKELSKEALRTFTMQLSELLKAELPLYESLLSLEEQYRGENFHSLIHSLCEQIKGGSSLSKALQLYPKSFSPQYIAMVRSGEAVGALAAALDKLHTMLTKELKLRKHIVSALLYPALLFSFSCFTLILLLTFVVPSIEVIFAERSCNWITRLVMSLSHLLTQKWPYLLAGGAFVALLSYYFSKKETFRYWISKKLLEIPFVRLFILESVLARFSRTLGSLLKGGVSMIEALELAKKVMKHPILEKVVSSASEKIVAGSLLSLELKKSPLIPTLVPRLIAVGEESGTLPEMLIKIADLYEEEVDKRVTRILALSQPIILLIMGGIVGVIMLAVLLPLTDVNSFIGG